MKLSLDLRTSLTQTLTPQQIQYLKLLQLPLVQLEQHVMQEIEQNPMLDDGNASDEIFSSIISDDDEYNPAPQSSEPSGDFENKEPKENPEPRDLIDDQGDPFEFHNMIWEETKDYTSLNKYSQNDDEDSEYFQIRDNTSFSEDLMQQLSMLYLSREELFLGEIIIGNLDDDGYLRRDLGEIVDETNNMIAEFNFDIEQKQEELRISQNGSGNPAKKYSLGNDSLTALDTIIEKNPEIASSLDSNYLDLTNKIRNGTNGTHKMMPIDLNTAERVLSLIRQLDPPGVGSRDVRECLLAQCKAVVKPNAAQKLATMILEEAYDAFAKKHYHVIKRQLGVSEDYIREAIEVIRKLNPRPGGSDYQNEMNTVIPDFTISRDEETDELLISLNDNMLPVLKLNSAYEKLKKEAQYKKFNKDTREWIRNKYEDAKFLIQAIRQRKSTMLKVMTAIAHLQEEFFYEGDQALKPLIYKNVAEETGLDISTVCRIVNNKYVMTDFGTYELKYFFSEALPNEDGEEVATRVIKQKLRDIIDEENKKKPYSDDKLSAMLKEYGYNVARRTVAKYREQMKIPVARLRKEL